MSEHLTFHTINEQRESGNQPTVLIERSRSGEILTATATGQYNDAGKEYFLFTEDGEQKAKPLGSISLADQTQERLAAELAADRSEENEYDRLLYDPSYGEGISPEEAVQRARVDTEYISEQDRERIVEDAARTLDNAARQDPDILRAIQMGYEAAGMTLPATVTKLIEGIHDTGVIRGAVKDYLYRKAQYYRQDLPERPRGHGYKRPNYKGGEQDLSFNVAVEYAVRRISGEWDEAKEDGITDVDESGRGVGQHRVAADIILYSPSMKQ